MLEINYETCINCGLCIKSCPFSLLRANKDGSPKMIKGGDELCINCGHCVSVCPEASISLDRENNLETYDKNLVPKLEEMETLIKSRRSIRKFKSEKIENEKLEKLIDITRWAPTGKNIQPVNWIVVNDDEKIHKLASFVIEFFQSQNLFPEIVKAFEHGIDFINRKAPHLIITYTSDFVPSSADDSIIALTTLELTASSIGIGTCWAGFLKWGAIMYPPIAEYLNIPEEHKITGAMMLGYPEIDYDKVPKRKEANIKFL